jgi:hypothetical protein
MRYEIKVTFGEVSLKLRQTNWNAARNNVDVVGDEFSSRIAVNTYLTIDIWTRAASTHIDTVLCASVPSAQNDGLPVKLAPRVFDSTMDTPSSLESA